jgi:GDPmannose 4,6-dehydratase
VDENTLFHPQSPYAVAKADAFQLVKQAREEQGLFACTGILFNHESPLRPSRFVTQKIIQGVLKIARNIKEGRTPEKLRLGNLAISRDWGWAPEYVEVMWLMLQQDIAGDIVIATGKTHSLEEFVQIAFAKQGLRWQDHVFIDQSLFRPNEALEIRANPRKVKDTLGWEAQKSLRDIIDLMEKAQK